MGVVLLMEDVVYVPLSDWQKPGCINRTAEYECPNEAIQEAVVGTSHVRCCADVRCMDKAAGLARVADWAFRGVPQ
jgi:hypothetical protein